MSNIDRDLDGLFVLPLAEFTSARNSLAARLKKEGRSDEAELVKSLATPSVSAWAVNQLYWLNRKAFDKLIEAGERFRQAQASQLAGKSSDVSGPRDTRRDAIFELSRQAAALLRDADHNASADTMRRITTTLEAISAYASLPDAPRPGRLTEDVAPPGFEALAELLHTNSTPRTPKEPPHNTERILMEARARSEVANAALKDAAAATREADRQRREAEAAFRKAVAAFEEAEQNERRLAAEAKKAADDVQRAARTLSEATKIRTP